MIIHFIVDDELVAVIVVVGFESLVDGETYTWNKFSTKYSALIPQQDVVATSQQFNEAADWLLSAVQTLDDYNLTWNHAEGPATALRIRGALPGRGKFIRVRPGAIVSCQADGVDIVPKVMRLTLRNAESALPRGLRAQGCQFVALEPRALQVPNATSCCDFDGPPPHFWPVATIRLTDASSSLLQTLRLLEQKHPELEFKVEQEKTDGAASFQRDDGLAIRVAGQPEVLALNENKANAQCYGGNFLTTLCGDQPVLFCGYCPFDPRRTPEPMLELLAQRCVSGNINVVKVDTGWLKVGHIDEIVSFPCPGVALIASPALYMQLATGLELSPEAVTLNKAITVKLEALKLFLTSRFDMRVAEIPVLFQACRKDLGNFVTTVHGNAVNCIYLGRYSIHSTCPYPAVNELVAATMKEFGYEAQFVDTAAANDDGGGGGNVHCLTATTHRAMTKK